MVLLVSLVLVGALCNSPKAFYKRVCNKAIPFQEKLEDFYAGIQCSYALDKDECEEEVEELCEDLPKKF